MDVHSNSSHHTCVHVPFFIVMWFYRNGMNLFDLISWSYYFNYFTFIIFSDVLHALASKFLRRCRRHLVARSPVCCRISIGWTNPSCMLWRYVGNFVQVCSCVSNIAAYPKSSGSFINFLNSRTGVRLRSALMTMVYKKIMKLSSLGDKSIGEVRFLLV